MPGSGRQLEKWDWRSVARMGLYAERGIDLGEGAGLFVQQGIKYLLCAS